MQAEDDDDEEIVREERAIYIVLALVGTPIAIAVLAEGGTFDAGPTISLACVVLAIVGLAHLLRRPPRIPRAEVRTATRSHRPADRATGSRRPPR